MLCCSSASLSQCSHVLLTLALPGFKIDSASQRWGTNGGFNWLDVVSLPRLAQPELDATGSRHHLGARCCRDPVQQGLDFTPASPYLYPISYSPPWRRLDSTQTWLCLDLSVQSLQQCSTAALTRRRLNSAPHVLAHSAW